ncbi:MULTISPECIES: HamA C-terminal domain-containing protein [unclassified Brevundimonas]|uniref:HamA C-terminal domain-containing protein n=1 Tax=unclassified Brevundimonas TaxID=2622653 RepID=UPI0025C6FAAA|nr:MULTISPECIES: DUF1837 domain-containing protein [unclassified Brevundimonas]
MSSITPLELAELAVGDPDELNVHLHLVERDVVTSTGLKVKVHCHCLTVDASGKIRLARLAEFMRDAIVDYAIPRSKREQARARDAQFKSTSAMTGLYHEARATFTDLDQSGEGGELLLHLLAQRFLKLPQVLCKMALKTDGRMHYHGADGVYASVDDDGVLKLFWGESKLYASASDAIRACLQSIAPFLTEPDSQAAARDRDLVLLSDNADLDDPKLTAAFKLYFDKTKKHSTRVRYAGVALVGFDADFYPENDAEAVADEIAQSAKAQVEKWVERVGARLVEEKLEKCEIELFCLPLPSAEGFRKAFKTALGLDA